MLSLAVLTVDWDVGLGKNNKDRTENKTRKRLESVKVNCLKMPRCLSSNVMGLLGARRERLQ